MDPHSLEKTNSRSVKAYDFYLGGKDSCKGDSGGPLYTWKNGKVKQKFLFLLRKNKLIHSTVGVYYTQSVLIRNAAKSN